MSERLRRWRLVLDGGGGGGDGDEPPPGPPGGTPGPAPLPPPAARGPRRPPPPPRAGRGPPPGGPRPRRPRAGDIDWGRTVAANLRHYQPELGTVIPERLVGYGRRQRSLRDVVVCADQSGSMAQSVVYAGICACVLASLRAVDTRLVVFDTSVVDLSSHL